MSHTTEKLEVCPYNPAHTILKYRMQTHLHKCRKNYPTHDWGFCLHNATHQLPLAELKYHEEKLCPDRHSFQSKQYQLSAAPVNPIAPFEHIQLPEPEENWDDGQTNSFDPKKNAEKKSMIRGAHCVPPSERKAFKLEHRRRVREREYEEAANGPIKSEPKPELMSQDKPEESLRLPRELPRGFSIGRGARKPASDQMPESSGPVGSFSKLSIGSDASAPQGVSKGVNSERLFAVRTGGMPIIATSPEHVPLPNAWGRGKPQF